MFMQRPHTESFTVFQCIVAVYFINMYYCIDVTVGYIRLACETWWKYEQELLVNKSTVTIHSTSVASNGMHSEY